MTTHAKKISAEELTVQARRILDNMHTGVDPDEVVCMMGVIVTKNENNPVDENGNPMVQLQHFVLGDPDDIRKMMVFMVEHSFEMPEEDEENSSTPQVH
jgi:hypothetical protein